jgi:hypothetical protein
MADGLVASGALLGRNAKEVALQLGPPTDTDKFKSDDLVYWLGAERGFPSVDSERLVIRFAAGKLVEARIVRDRSWQPSATMTCNCPRRNPRPLSPGLDDSHG